MNLKAERLELQCVCQGDIIRKVDCLEYATEKEGTIEVSRIQFPLVIVLTQDCDLEQDHKLQISPDAEEKDKLLISVLVAPLYNAEHVYEGSHLFELDIPMQIINKNRSPGKNLRINERPRYHFLDFPPVINLVPSVIDVKHYFSVNVNHLTRIKRESYVCTLSALYREDVSQRFSSYLSRIGLPDIKTAPSSQPTVS